MDRKIFFRSIISCGSDDFYRSENAVLDRRSQHGHRKSQCSRQTSVLQVIRGENTQLTTKAELNCQSRISPAVHSVPVGIMSGSAVPKPCFTQTLPRRRKPRQNTFSEVDLSRRKSSPATAGSRSTRARTSQGSCCRLSSPTAKARRGSVDLPNDRRRRTRQKRTTPPAAARAA